ncbi:MAG: ATPase, T2SS/T4P/T4SS family [Geminicoccaceae bacterium]
MPPALAALVAEAGVEEVMVNPDGRVWVERTGSLESTDISLDERVRETLARRLASSLGLDFSPLFTGTVGEARVQVVLPPLVKAPALTFRLPAARAFSLEDFFVSPAQRALIENAVASGRSVLVSGGISSGKTSFANALLALPAFASARLVVIEDTPELRPLSSDVVSLHAGEQASARELLRAALRLRPDRLILGEVRGGEAYDLLQALNTGHGGSLSTIHANTAEDALFRLLDLAREAVPGFSGNAIRRANPLVVQLGRRDGRRCLLSINDSNTSKGDFS